MKGKTKKWVLLFLVFIIITLNFVSSASGWIENLNDGLFAYYNFSSNLESVSGGDNNLIVKRGNPQFIQNSSSFQLGDNKSGFCPGSNSADGWNVNNQKDFAFNDSNIPNISFAGWAKTIISSGGRPLFSKGWTNTGWTLAISNVPSTSRDIRLFLGGLSNNELLTDSNKIKINENQWYHIAVTKDSNQTCIWINGTQEDCELSKIAETNNFEMDVCGSFDDSVAFQGYLDEWGFWNRTLNESEILQLYNNGSGITYARLSLDLDNDGFDNTVDCDDNNNQINPGANEICDDLDNNCDNVIDEGFDEDNDSIANCFDSCPNSKQQEPVDDNGCDIFQFCSQFNQMCLGCEKADWKNNELQKNPNDCILQIKHNNGIPQELVCVPTEFSDSCAG